MYSLEETAGALSKFLEQTEFKNSLTAVDKATRETLESVFHSNNPGHDVCNVRDILEYFCGKHEENFQRRLHTIRKVSSKYHKNHDAKLREVRYQAVDTHHKLQEEVSKLLGDYSESVELQKDGKMDTVALYKQRGVLREHMDAFREFSKITSSVNPLVSNSVARMEKLEDRAMFGKTDAEEVLAFLGSLGDVVGNREEVAE